jgi:hypothetical protein
MRGPRIVALIVALLLLWPIGGCLVFGISALQLHNGIFAILFLLPGSVFWAISSLLFWVAFRREGSSALRSGVRVAAFVFAILLLLPTASGLFLGIIFAHSHFNYVLLPISVVIFGIDACLFWFALRRKSQVAVA